MLEGFLFYYNFVSADSCGFARRGGTRSSEALLPSGHGKRAVARVAGKALAARTGCCRQPPPTRFRRRRIARQSAFGD